MSNTERRFRQQHNDEIKRIDVKQSVIDMRRVKDKMTDAEFCKWYGHKYYFQTKLRADDIFKILQSAEKRGLVQ